MVDGYYLKRHLTVVGDGKRLVLTDSGKGESSLGLWRRLAHDEGKVHDDDLVECGHECGGECGVLLVTHARCQVAGIGEGHGEDVGEALGQRLLVQNVLSPASD